MLNKIVYPTGCHFERHIDFVTQSCTHSHIKYHQYHAEYMVTKKKKDHQLVTDTFLANLNTGYCKQRKPCRCREICDFPSFNFQNLTDSWSLSSDAKYARVKFISSLQDKHAKFLEMKWFYTKNLLTYCWILCCHNNFSLKTVFE